MELTTRISLSLAQAFRKSIIKIQVKLRRRPNLLKTKRKQSKTDW